MHSPSLRRLNLIKWSRLCFAALTLLLIGFYSMESAMWGGTTERNMISHEKNLPANWDPASGLNIKWSAALGSQTYGNPVISGGKIVSAQVTSATIKYSSSDVDPLVAEAVRRNTVPAGNVSGATDSSTRKPW